MLVLKLQKFNNSCPLKFLCTIAIVLYQTLIKVWTRNPNPICVDFFWIIACACSFGQICIAWLNKWPELLWMEHCRNAWISQFPCQLEDVVVGVLSIKKNYVFIILYMEYAYAWYCCGHLVCQRFLCAENWCITLPWHSHYGLDRLCFLNNTLIDLHLFNAKNLIG
jgi:hypothetical protein